MKTAVGECACAHKGNPKSKSKPDPNPYRAALEVVDVHGYLVAVRHPMLRPASIPRLLRKLEPDRFLNGWTTEQISGPTLDMISTLANQPTRSFTVQMYILATP
jgi:hypothetical protein